MADESGQQSGQNGQATRSISGQIMPNVGAAQPSLGDLATVDVLVQARVGQMRAEMERDLNERLARIDDLPTKWQLIAGGATAIGATIGVLFALLAYFGDRQDSAVERSATVAESLTEMREELKEIRDEQRQQPEQIRPPAKRNGPRPSP